MATDPAYWPQAVIPSGVTPTLIYKGTQRTEGFVTSDDWYIMGIIDTTTWIINKHHLSVYTVAGPLVADPEQRFEHRLSNLTWKISSGTKRSWTLDNNDTTRIAKLLKAEEKNYTPTVRTIAMLRALEIAKHLKSNKTSRLNPQTAKSQQEFKETFKPDTTTPPDPDLLSALKQFVGWISLDSHKLILKDDNYVFFLESPATNGYYDVKDARDADICWNYIATKATGLVSWDVYINQFCLPYFKGSVNTVLYDKVISQPFESGVDRAWSGLKDISTDFHLFSALLHFQLRANPSISPGPLHAVAPSHLYPLGIDGRTQLLDSTLTKSSGVSITDAPDKVITDFVTWFESIKGTSGRALKHTTMDFAGGVFSIKVDPEYWQESKVTSSRPTVSDTSVQIRTKKTADMTITTFDIKNAVSRGSIVFPKAAAKTGNNFEFLTLILTLPGTTLALCKKKDSVLLLDIGTLDLVKESPKPATTDVEFITAWLKDAPAEPLKAEETPSASGSLKDRCLFLWNKANPDRRMRQVLQYSLSHYSS